MNRPDGQVLRKARCYTQVLVAASAAAASCAGNRSGETRRDRPPLRWSSDVAFADRYTEALTRACAASSVTLASG